MVETGLFSPRRGGEGSPDKAPLFGIFSPSLCRDAGWTSGRTGLYLKSGKAFMDGFIPSIKAGLFQGGHLRVFGPHLWDVFWT